jgi:ProP effector
MTTDTGSTQAPYAWLQDRYPAAFPQERGDIRPLKVDIHLDILAAYPELTPQALKKMLAIWCGRPMYQKALMRGGPRVDLHGLPAGEVTPEQRAHAQEKLKALSARAKERKAAATKPAEAQKAATPAGGYSPDTGAHACPPDTQPEAEVVSARHHHGRARWRG